MWLQVFESSRFLGKQGWRFAMQASMLEIYNEEYKDLLARKKLPDGKVHKVCGPHLQLDAGVATMRSIVLSSAFCWESKSAVLGIAAPSRVLAWLTMCHFSTLCKQCTAPGLWFADCVQLLLRHGVMACHHAVLCCDLPCVVYCAGCPRPQRWHNSV